MNRIAFCGNNCDFCPRYIATKNESIEELRRCAEIWYKLGWREKK